MSIPRIRVLAAGAFGLLPEGRVKHTVRSLLLSVFPSLPRRAFLNPGDCVLQVGTPSPQAIHYILDIIGNFGRVIVIEPEEGNVRRLKSDERIAGATNVVIVERAAWSCREPISFTVSKSPYDHKIAIPGIVHDNDYVEGNYCGRRAVQGDTIDNILEEFDVQHVDFAEIHVNGAEIEVLRGMRRSLDIVDRIHLKGHSLCGESKQPMNVLLVSMLKQRQFYTKIAAVSKSRQEAREAVCWQYRAGDVYGARF